MATVTTSKVIDLTQLTTELGKAVVTRGTSPDASGEKSVTVDGVTAAALAAALDAHTPVVSPLKAKAARVKAGLDTFTVTELQNILADLVLRGA